MHSIEENIFTALKCGIVPVLGQVGFFFTDNKNNISKHERPILEAENTVDCTHPQSDKIVNPYH